MIEALRERESALDTAMSPRGSADTGGIENLDDYSACEITAASDIKHLFTENFYFGCEADDRMNTLAFNTKNNPFRAQIHALFGSDIGHFDVPNMAHVLRETHEFVEDGLMTPDNFKDFTCDNPIRIFGETNPDFFKGTVVADTASAVLSAQTD